LKILPRSMPNIRLSNPHTLIAAREASMSDSEKFVEICTQYAQRGMFNVNDRRAAPASRAGAQGDPCRPVRLIVLLPGEDEAGGFWADGVASEWSAELSDPREDIYTLEDGQLVDATP
jgi:hypothetical protein